MKTLPSQLAIAALALLLMCPASHAASLPGAHVSATELAQPADYPGVEHLYYEYGPIDITPGQNTIEVKPSDLNPRVPGYITRFAPNLVYADTREVPRVDVLHLHHGVWLINGYPTFAAGEEKTNFNFPQGYGLHHDPKDGWIVSYMIHNLTPQPSTVYLTYAIDFVPDTEAASQSITPIHPLWLDVSGLKPYPVFDAFKGQGKRGRFTFPDQASKAQQADIGAAHQWVAPRDFTLVATAGHLHPGGLYTDLAATRGRTTKQLFRSEAKYFEPAGAVSWDVSMTATKPAWRIAIKRGDRLNVSTTYDTRDASWYESMGIMVTFVADGTQPGAVDPFSAAVDTRGVLTHGHLPENDNHGGRPTSLPDARKLLLGPATTGIAIRNYVYGRGDLSIGGAAGRPPAVRAGKALKFTNFDATAAISAAQSAYHTITACKAPCTASTGIAYPLANAKIQFDSGELGYGPTAGPFKLTPAANRNTWSTPKSLPSGTYTYFCRIHPFMRGAFRVVPAGKRSKTATLRR
jgi:plastocyanin